MKYTVAVNSKGEYQLLEASQVPYAKGTTLNKATKLLKELQHA